MNTDTSTPKKHYGRNIKRLREILDIKQETLALDLGISQQTVSDLEQREEIEDAMLKKVAQALNVPVEAIKSFSDEATHNYINTFNDAVTNHNGFYNFNCTFNPIDKIIELYKEKEIIFSEKEKLYERMLEAEKEKNEFLKKLLDK